ncbi:PutativeNAD-dependent epimerase [Halomicronema hongdechloris C2206]|uniref:PutativeNAD-dependent epimerase n=1 Tax=Halomicronema hongdechloris C2206 TaxID=1641165 RepID=A0A1Z3HSG9_9CYAN|nr:NAD-dependent epimerase/dehydratase family protein [Halomicronema hongdechloris]ASC73202.1 PutativeNAD-dependent epimerase [Halomicronema hongdechloris C2206]
MGKRCLVTGGLGFIGQHLVRLLQQRGHTIRILDLDRPQQPQPTIDYVQASIVDAEPVTQAMADIDWVFHLAANAGLWAPRKQDFLTINQQGTRTVMAAAQAAGVERVVHTSTESILKCDRIPADGQETDESIRLEFDDMVGPYCQGKFLAEREALAAAARGLPVVIVNPTIPIGPGDRRLTPPSRMLLGFLNGRYPAFLNSTLNLIDARDVALGHLLAAEKGQVGERYILGQYQPGIAATAGAPAADYGALHAPAADPLWTGLCHQCGARILGRSYYPSSPGGPPNRVRLARSPLRFSSHKAQQQLGLTCRPIEVSLADAVQDYQARGLLRRPLPKAV